MSGSTLGWSAVAGDDGGGGVDAVAVDSVGSAAGVSVSASVLVMLLLWLDLCFFWYLTCLLIAKIISGSILFSSCIIVLLICCSYAAITVSTAVDAAVASCWGSIVGVIGVAVVGVGDAGWVGVRGVARAAVVDAGVPEPVLVVVVAAVLAGVWDWPLCHGQ